jgi:hypothetical protein
MDLSDESRRNCGMAMTAGLAMTTPAIISGLAGLHALTAIQRAFPHHDEGAKELN